MNEELKHKMHSVYGQILVQRKLMSAWQQVKDNKGSGGIDGVTIDSFKANEEENISNLLAKLKDKMYKPTSVKRVYIPKKNGKMRPLGIPTIEDRIVQQSVVNVLNPKFENEIFHRWSCGYREGLGAERTMQIILWNIETGYNHIYDCDIKGFFDNIPHKNLMRVVAKYIADGTVLDMIWKWLKAGYMEDSIYHDTVSGTPQGGVISPLLANIYLNELDWELDKEGIRFVRYADDFLLFAKTEESIKKAGEVAKRVIAELGLEVSMEKTKFVDFNNDDFDFMGFTFKHWRNRKKDGSKYFVVTPTENSLKDFKKKIKEKTMKSLTLSTKAWIDRLNPIIRGKVNYYLNLHKAIKANEKHGQKSSCVVTAMGQDLHNIDAYTRRRLRIAMIHKSPTQRKGYLMTSKWNNEYFARIGLIPGNWLYFDQMWGYDIETYIQNLTKKAKKKLESKILNKRKRGQEYYTPDLIKSISATKAYV
ncbi:MAG: group II intron reverse transcriptase/maturase [Tissierellaceae bacterium]|nr:group II intron reverse transcriptase/maturase [Tissierellaceae bacterium]